MKDREIKIATRLLERIAKSKNQCLYILIKALQIKRKL